MFWEKPKTISVVINTCNRAVSPNRTIRAVLQQAASNLENIVVNGPSKGEIIRSNADALQKDTDAINSAAYYSGRIQIWSAEQ